MMMLVAESAISNSDVFTCHDDIADMILAWDAFDFLSCVEMMTPLEAVVPMIHVS